MTIVLTLVTYLMFAAVGLLAIFVISTTALALLATWARWVDWALGIGDRDKKKGSKQSCIMKTIKPLNN